MIFRYFFNWATRKWRQRRRAIYHFFDGHTWRTADPIRLFREFQHHERFRMDEEWMALVDGQSEPETTCALDAICEVFNVRRYDEGSGLTDSELMDLWADLIGWLHDLEKKNNPGLTLSDATASESSDPLEHQDSTTSSQSACGSRNNTQPDDEQQEPSKPLETPSDSNSSGNHSISSGTT